MASKRKGARVGDPNFDETISRELNEIGSDFSDDSMEPDEYLQNSDHNSGFEISCVEIENTNQNIGDECECQDCQEKNGKYVEQQSHQQSDQVSEHSTVKSYYGKNRNRRASKEFTRYCSTTLEVWKYILTQEMADEVILHTNNKLWTLQAKYSRENKPELTDLDCVGFDALLGVFYYWPMYYVCERILILLACLRFDNPEGREQRKENDPSAVISWIFNELVKHYQLSYSLGELVCIDEMLVVFRGRYRFRIYMPNKP
ncbi:hypothetical protein PR048_020826 [Dryococelus australis]|uniref:PiggyBac transposable element-derived protein domain-containing protein n=1 Tax=Dryococelus australis TaxID=614101 RepID=A0ABQ9GWK5_9NEOP|nr:hypothetical protein PR048_020826 [Dryococelus australis]